MKQSGALFGNRVHYSYVQLQGNVIEVLPKEKYKGVNRIANKSILTPTSGFLDFGYTHTLNPYVGCSNAGSLCGTFCYAQHFRSTTKGRPWGLYGAKRNIGEAYQRDYDRLKYPRKDAFCAKCKSPFAPQQPERGG